MIGLVDIGLQSSDSARLTVPNIEIMKLATYYKYEENKFCRLINLDETELTPYDKIYIFSEAETAPELPDAFRRAKNVVLGGTAFTNGVYKPFKNEIIDYTLPKTFIYKEFLKEKNMAGIDEKVLEHILDDTYYRMYAGDNKLPMPPILSRKRVFIYDKDIFVPDWQNIMKRINSHNPSSIKPIHPIYCHNITDYFLLREQLGIARDTVIILDFKIPLEDTPYLMKKYKNRFLADMPKTSSVCVSLGGTFDTQYQYYKDCIYKLNLLYVFWSNNIPLKIKYITPSTGHIDPLTHLSKLIENWTYSESKRTKCISDRIPKNKHMMEVRLEREERDKMLELFPAAKTLFL